MDQTAAMALFALTMSISPGPVNLITLSTGLNLGVRNALGFVSGATAGFTLLLFSIGLGLSAIAQRYGFVIDTLTFLGAGLIVYFGFKLLTSSGDLNEGDHTKPSFWQGAALQWLNPKAWGACIAAVGLFELDQNRTTLYFFVCLYCVICFFGIGSWAVFGSQVERYMGTPNRRRLLNRFLGGTLIFLAVFLLWQQFVR
ncbi:LysE family translocator [Labrenzia sp. PHM005]|uniref:LysE family translocator n=1 Tax=Labrenzia sp. PHM005 TaxID=2590016 RepID=UPI00114084EE|nr:LysE family translocator [Labrenzia sp. PHM005]QDG78565.1 LysE family translocator [Labrenzia sp. PHM005]